MARNQSTTRRSPQQRKAAAQHNDHPSLLTAVLGIAGGIGVGVGVMYLLDPSSGRGRREYLAGRASDLAHSAWDTAREHAADASSHIAAAGPAIGDRLMDHVRSAREMAESEARSHLANLPEMPRFASMRDKISSYLPSFSRRRSRAPIAAAATGAGLAAVAIGATAMWLFDPDRGRSRRAWIGQKLHRATNETGQFMRATGRHLANKGQGMYHETRAAAQEAIDSGASHFRSKSKSEPKSGPTETVNPPVPSI